MSKYMREIKELHAIISEQHQNIIFLLGYLTTKFKNVKNTCSKVEVGNNNCICFGITRLDLKCIVTHMWNQYLWMCACTHNLIRTIDD